MIFKTDLKLKTTIIAIFALIVIATACMVCLSCTNDTIEKSDDTSYLTQWVDTGLPVVRIDTKNGVDVVSKEEWQKNASLSLSGGGGRRVGFQCRGGKHPGAGKLNMGAAKKAVCPQARQKAGNYGNARAQAVGSDCELSRQFFHAELHGVLSEPSAWGGLYRAR